MNPSAPAASQPPSGSVHPIFKLAGLIVLLVASGMGGTCLARWMRSAAEENQVEVESSQAAKGLPAALARWKKPDLVLALTAQQYGYLLPCGCSRPQVGGLERRFNYLAALKDAGWPIAAVDLGDIAQKQGPAGLTNLQGLVKYRYSMEALKLMNYGAVSLGQTEANLSLFKILGEYALNNPEPRVVLANLRNKESEFPEQVFDTSVFQPKGSSIKVGVTAVTGPTAAEAIKDSSAKFELSREAIPRALAALRKEKAELLVLLYQGSIGRAANDQSEPIAAAKAFPDFQVILCECDEDEPPGQPLVVKHADGRTTQIVRMGHKAKYVGTMGVYKADGAFTFTYHLEDLGEQWLTAEGKEKEQPVVELMERYARELDRGQFLSKTPQATHSFSAAQPDSKPQFVGSEKCKRCHESAYKVWQESPHSHAWQTLADAKKPGLRHRDPECIVCHTVGFGFQSGFVDETKTPFLKNVGCESCHGPSSEHLNSPDDPVWHRLMNPWKAKPGESAAESKSRTQRMDQFCQKCHDMDNDVTWSNQGFARKWPKIAHPTPKESR